MGPSKAETSLRIIREVGVRPGQTLPVSGASGGVGSAVLQIARERAITVTGTAGAANQDYLRGLGALATTYDEGWGERVRHLCRVDAALDLAGSGVIRGLVEPTGDPRRTAGHWRVVNSVGRNRGGYASHTRATALSSAEIRFRPSAFPIACRACRPGHGAG